jgi:hypothetical protein
MASGTETEDEAASQALLQARFGIDLPETRGRGGKRQICQTTTLVGGNCRRSAGAR